MPSITIRIDEELDESLSRLAEAQGRSKSNLVRHMLRRQLALVAFDKARKELLPLGEQAGLLTDEDVFDVLS